MKQFGGIIKSLGLVFGDIGTSPIYTVTVVFLTLDPTPSNVMGVMSLIFWTLVALVTVQYAWLAMSLSIRGEGGNVVLREIMMSTLHSTGKRPGIMAFLPIIGVSLLIGDGVLTPAISIVSAVEGSLLIPWLSGLSRTAILIVAAIIAIGLFSFQSKGTGKVAGAFGPIVVVWFSSLGVFGLMAISEAPEVLSALNPMYCIRFFEENGFKGFLALGEIILCATGGEAMYADMGHLGSKPIRQAWGGVFIALAINYLGQGAFLLKHPEVKTILFGMVFHYANILYVPFLLLSIAATVIASQAMISGMFSVVYQGITTRIMPMFKVEYTSTELRSQIYIGTINWSLLAAVIFIMFEFQDSGRLAAAYGIAVTGTMTLTGIIMAYIFYLKGLKALSAVSAVITLVDAGYLGANIFKIPHGGYWSLVLALVPFVMIMIYIYGHRRLYRSMSFMRLEDFMRKFNSVYESTNKIKGSALFLVKDVSEIPFYITQTMFYHGIIYDDNVFVSIVKRQDPFGVTGIFKEDLAKGLRVFEIQMGYMEVVDVSEILREALIEERAVFYGLEDIATGNPLWRIFRLIKRNTPAYIQFYRFPPKKLHGVLTRVEI